MLKFLRMLLGKQPKSAAISHFQALRNREFIHDRLAVLTADAENDYYKEELATIPAGAQLVLDFAGDFGCYAVADVRGVLHRVKIPITDIHKIKLLDYKVGDLEQNN